MKFILLSIVCFLCSLPTIWGQKWELGARAGAALYHGDLAPDLSLQSPKPSVNIYFRRNFDARLCLRTEVSFAQIGAADSKSKNEYRRRRNLSFRSNIFEASLSMEFNFLPYHFSRRTATKPFTPYLVAGFGVLSFNPQASYKDAWYDLRDLHTEGQGQKDEYSLVQPAFILGFGFKADITHNIGIMIEGSTRLLFTDYLDDVSKTYTNPKRLSGDLARALADRSMELEDATAAMGREGYQRGDSNNNDGYTLLSIGINYYILRVNCHSF